MLASATADRIACHATAGVEHDPPPARPRTRGDCKDGLRPCPYVGCSHHLLFDVDEYGSLFLARKTSRAGRRAIYDPGSTPQGRALVEAWIDAAVDAVLEAEETCALDIADRYTDAKGVAPFDLIGRLIRVGKQRAHQLCVRALKKVCAEHGWEFDDVRDRLVEMGRL
jgi:hypothetical protein